VLTSFFEAIAMRDARLPEALRAFIDKLQTIGAYPEFQRSLNLKWDPPSGKPVNLGYIQRDGQVWTEAANWNVPAELSRRYIEDLAGVWGAEVERERLGGNWHVRVNGRAPRIEALLGKLDAWFGAAERFIESLRAEAAR
jgi:hypothetical protein